MNWHRGLLLAGIHLCIAVPLIVWLAANDATYVRDHSNSQQRLIDAPGVPTGHEGKTISVGPCRTIWVDCPAQITIVRLANFPAFVLTYWRSERPAPWSLAGVLHADSPWPPTPSSVAAQKRVDLGLIILIAVQWFLVGGFPLVRPRRWWWEPGIVVTIGTVLSGLSALTPNHWDDSLATGPVVVGWFAWFWLLGLLIWKTVRAGRRKSAEHHV
jgi:hypothetical protein